MINLHPTKVYQVEYSQSVMYGWSDIEMFLKWLSGKANELDDYSLFIPEDESYVECSFDFFEKLQYDETYGSTIKEIIANSDKTNSFVHLEIF